MNEVEFERKGMTAKEVMKIRVFAESAVHSQHEDRAGCIRSRKARCAF